MLFKPRNAALLEVCVSGAANAYLGSSGVRFVSVFLVAPVLQVCAEVGLSDVHLCTTPDVVEKRSLKSVCQCVRTLAVRLSHLGVTVWDTAFHACSVRRTGCWSLILLRNRCALEHLL